MDHLHQKARKSSDFVVQNVGDVAAINSSDMLVVGIPSPLKK